MITENFTSGKYTAAGKNAGVTFNEGTTKTSATYYKQKGGQQFTVTGLASDLTVQNGKLMSGTVEVGTITVSGTTGTVKLTSLAALENGDTVDQTFSLTNTDIKESGADKEIKYSFEFDKDTFNFLNDTSDVEKPATFEPGSSSGEYKYSTAHTPAYTSLDNTTSKYTYHKEVPTTEIVIQGLTALNAEGTYKVEGNAIKDSSGNTIANIVPANLTADPPVTTTKIELTEHALPTNITDTTQKIQFGSTYTGYELDVVEAKKSSSATDGELKDGTLTMPTWSEYFTVADSVITPHAKIEGTTFTFKSDGTPIAALNGTISTDNKIESTAQTDLSYTLKSSDGNTDYGTITANVANSTISNYTITIKEAFLNAAAASGVESVTLDDTDATLELDTYASSATAEAAPAKFVYESGKLVYKSYTEGGTKYTLDNGTKTITIKAAATATSLFSISGLKSDLQGKTFEIYDNENKKLTGDLAADTTYTIKTTEGTEIGKLTKDAQDKYFVKLNRATLPDTPTTVALTPATGQSDDNFTLSLTKSDGTDAQINKPADKYNFANFTTDDSSGNQSATYQLEATGEYWTQNGNSYTYNEGTKDATQYFTLSGLKGFTSLSVNGNKLMGTKTGESEAKEIGSIAINATYATRYDVSLTDAAFTKSEVQTITCNDNKANDNRWYVLTLGSLTPRYGTSVTAAQLNSGAYTPAKLSAGYPRVSGSNKADYTATSNITYMPEQRIGKEVTITNLNGSVKAGEILPYIEIDSADKLQNYCKYDNKGNYYLQSGSYKLTADIKTNFIILVDKNVVFDLADKTLTTSKNNAFSVIEGGDLTINDSGTTGKITGATAAAISIYPTGTTTTASLTVNGGKIEGGSFGIAGNGSSNLGTTNITINGGTITGHYGIYHPQKGQLIINDGTITGTTGSGIEIRSGSLYVNGGTIQSTTENYSCKHNTTANSGSTTTGAGIAIAQHTTCNEISVNITGGEIKGKVALSVANPEENTTNNLTANITGGTFTGDIYSLDNRVTPNIAGGNFTGNLVTSGIDVIGKNSTAVNHTAGSFAVLTVDGKSVAKFNDSQLDSTDSKISDYKSTTPVTITPPAKQPATGAIVFTSNTTAVVNSAAIDNSTVPTITGYTLTAGGDINTDKFVLDTAASFTTTDITDGKTFTFTAPKYKAFWSSDLQTSTAAQGGEQFTITLTDATKFKNTSKFMVLTDATTHACTLIYDGQTLGTVTVTDTGSDGTIDSYAFEVNKNFLDEMTSGTLTLAENTATGSTTATPFTLAIASEEGLYTTSTPTKDDDETAKAKFEYNKETSTATYTAAITAYKYFTLGTTDTDKNVITYHAATGRQQFTLTGDFSSTVTDATTFVIKEETNSSNKVSGHIIYANSVEENNRIGKVGISTLKSTLGQPSGTVYFTENAFDKNKNDPVITLKDADNNVDGISYYITDGSAPNLPKYSATTVGTAAKLEKGTEENEDKLFYTAAKSRAGIIITDTGSATTNASRTTTATYHAGGESIGSNFIATGLDTNLTESNIVQYKEVAKYADFNNSLNLPSGYYKLTNDIVIGSTSVLKISDNVVIDLNGHTIRYSDKVNKNTAVFTVKRGGDLTIMNSSNTPGTVTSKKSDSTSNPYVYAAVTLEPGGTYTEGGKTANLTVNGNVILEGHRAGVWGHGEIENFGTNITINGGTIRSTQTDSGLGIYHPQYGTLVINGGTIEGNNTAVELRAGNLYINGGTLKSTAQSYNVSSNGIGTTTTGAAVAIAQPNTDQNITAVITGGTFEGKTALSLSNPNGSAGANNTVGVTVTGGTFKGDIDNQYTRTSGDTTSNIGMSIGGTAKVTGSLTGSSKFEVAKGVTYTKPAEDTTSPTVNAVDKLNDVETKFAASESTAKNIYVGVVNGMTTVVVTKKDLNGKDFSVSGENVSMVISGDVPTLDSNNVPPVKAIATFTVNDDDNTATYTAPQYDEYYTVQGNGSYKHFKESGGEKITISGLDKITTESSKTTLYDYINLGNITVTPAYKLTNDQYTFQNFTVTVGKGFVEKLKQGESLTFTATKDNTAIAGDVINLAFKPDDFSEEYDSTGAKLLKKEGVEGDAAGVTAADENNATKLTYTSKVTERDYFKVNDKADDTNNIAANTITHVAQVGGQPFTLTGIDSTKWADFKASDTAITAKAMISTTAYNALSSEDKANYNAVTKNNTTDDGNGGTSTTTETIGYYLNADVGTTLATITASNNNVGGTGADKDDVKYTVTIKKDAFTADNQTITLNDSTKGDGVSYIVALDNTLTTTAETVTKGLTYANDTYTYTEGGTKEYAEAVTGGYKYHAQDKAQSFTITGLKSDLELYNGGIYAKSQHNTALGTITFSDDGKTGTVKLVSTDILATSTNSDKTVNITFKDGDDGINTANAIKYEITFDENAFGKDAKPTATSALEFTETKEGSGVYIYKLKGYKQAYTELNTTTGTYTYHPETKDKYFTISGLKSGLVLHENKIYDTSSWTEDQKTNYTTSKTLPTGATAVSDSLDNLLEYKAASGDNNSVTFTLKSDALLPDKFKAGDTVSVVCKDTTATPKLTADTTNFFKDGADFSSFTWKAPTINEGKFNFTEYKAAFEEQGTNKNTLTCARAKFGGETFKLAGFSTITLEQGTLENGTITYNIKGTVTTTTTTTDPDTQQSSSTQGNVGSLVVKLIPKADDSTTYTGIASYAFNITNKGALSVSDSNTTISVKQVDKEGNELTKATVDYTLNLDKLNGEAKPWVGGSEAFTNQKIGKYQYKTGIANNLNYVKKNSAEYTYNATPTDATDKYILEIQAGNNITTLTSKVLKTTYKDGFSSEEGGLTDKLKVDEIYNTENKLTGFVVTILSDNTLHGYENFAPNGTTIGNDTRTPLTDWISTVSATCTKDGAPATNIQVTVKLADNVAVGAKEGKHDEATLVYDENSKKYTYTTDTYVVGYDKTRDCW